MSASDFKMVYRASMTGVANGTIDPRGSARDRDVRLAVSLCRCGHQRNLHNAAGGVSAPNFDWRGGTGPCDKRIRAKTCSCKAFVASVTSEGER